MHKDRHGAQVSVEFDSSGAANPQTLGVLQEFFKVAVPQMGGVPEQHPGQPKGTDTVPAWLTPGEFVMNAEATRMFEPQIKQMNDAGRAVQAAQGGTIPEYKANGGAILPAASIDGNDFVMAAEYMGLPTDTKTLNVLVDMVNKNKRWTPLDAATELAVQRDSRRYEIKEGIPEVDRVPIFEDMYKSSGGPIPNYLAAGDYATWITPELLDSLRMVESGGDNSAISPAGAIGEYQWMPDSAANPGYGVAPFDPRDPEAARQATAQYLTGIQKAYGWGPEQTLQAYNMGPNALSQVLEGKRDMPEETVNYAGKVLGGVSGETEAPPEYISSTGNTVVDSVLSDMYKVPKGNDKELDPGAVNAFTNFFRLNGGEKSAEDIINVPGNKKYEAEIRAAEYAARKERKDPTADIPTIDDIPNPDAPPGTWSSHNGVPATDVYRRRIESAQSELSLAEATGDAKGVAKAKDKLALATRQYEEAKIQEPKLKQQQADVDTAKQQQREGLSFTPKPPKQLDATEVTKEQVKVEQTNLNNTDPNKVITAGTEAAKDPGLFKSAMNWIDENFGGILNSDDLKKMMLYYLGSRAFGNSHEGSANWVGTMFVKDSEKRQALYEKLALSGKYTEKSLAKFKKTNDMTDLIGVTTTEVDDTPEYYDLKVDGKNVTKQLRKVKYTQNGKTVTKYLDSDDKQYDLKENSIIKTSDREARINSIANNVKTAWDGGLDQVIPLGSLTGDKRAAAEAERAKLPKGDVVALKVAEFLQDSETHPTNAKVSTMTIALQGEMFDWVKQQKEAGVENPVLSAELIPAMLAKSQVRKIDGVGSLVGNTDFMTQTEIANKLISANPNVSAEMAVSKGFEQIKKSWDIDSKKPEVMAVITRNAEALSEASGKIITPFMLYANSRIDDLIERNKLRQAQK